MTIAAGSVIMGVWLATCSDTEVTNPPPPSRDVVVSDTTRLSGAALFARQAAATAFVDAEVAGIAFVSMSAGSVPNGELAILRNRRTDSATTAVLVNGGFDPQPVDAAPDDTLDIDIRLPGGTFEHFSVVVPRSRPPRVVRAFPPRGKTSVPLNSRMAITFTEPIDPATLPSAVTLHSGLDTLFGSWQLLRGGTEAVFEPAVQLLPNTTYRLDVTTQVRDGDGESLDELVSIDFTTGTNVDDSAESMILDVETITAFGMGSAGITDALTFMLRMTDATQFGDSGTPYPLFDDRAIREGDDGERIVASVETDPDFAGFATLMTDGIDQLVSITLADGFGSGGATQQASSFFTGRPGSGPDFAGYTIERVEFVIDSVRIVSPGRDPSGNGNWTDSDLSGRIVVIGRRAGGAAMQRVPAPPWGRQR